MGAAKKPASIEKTKRPAEERGAMRRYIEQKRRTLATSGEWVDHEGFEESEQFGSVNCRWILRSYFRDTHS